jgi:hypothetical protein
MILRKPSYVGFRQSVSRSTLADANGIQPFFGTPENAMKTTDLGRRLGVSARDHHQETDQVGGFAS